MDFFGEVVIIGMGLMGGSMALALKRRGYRGRIIGCDLSEEALKEAEKIGAIDAGERNISKAVRRAQLVVVAVPVGYYEAVFKEASPHLCSGTLVTDVGSVKRYVQELAAAFLPKGVEFLGGHPMAGSEKSGIKAANPYLYENAYYFLTPDKTASQGSVAKLKGLIVDLGAYPVIVDPNEHDRIVAQISHLPHLTAALLVNTLDRGKGLSNIPFAGGGFRDTTRIASGNPFMWRDIFLYNKEEIMRGVEELSESLQEFRKMIEGDNWPLVLETLQKAKLIRDSIPKHSRDYLPPLYEIIVSVEDRPGVLGELTRLIGENAINIKEIEILHAREGEKGAVRIGFASAEEEEKAVKVLRERNFPLTFRKGESEDA